MPEILIVSDNKITGNQFPSPSTLGLAYKLTKNDEIMDLGLIYARKILNAYLNQFPDGRTHGCGSKSVHAACVGHGRNWGSGYISSILRFASPNTLSGISLPPISFN